MADINQRGTIFIQWYFYSLKWHTMLYIQTTTLHINGLVLERHNAIANALGLHLSCINPSICNLYTQLIQLTWEWKSSQLGVLSNFVFEYQLVCFWYIKYIPIITHPAYILWCEVCYQSVWIVLCKTPVTLMHKQWNYCSLTSGHFCQDYSKGIRGPISIKIPFFQVWRFTL